MTLIKNLRSVSYFKRVNVMNYRHWTSADTPDTFVFILNL